MSVGTEIENEKNFLPNKNIITLDGYDSLGKLRKAYKAFNSDAYKEVAPAIQRLLKHKAIRYKE